MPRSDRYLKRNSNASRIVLKKSTTQLVVLIRPTSKPLQVLSLFYPKSLWPGTPPGQPLTQSALPMLLRPMHVLDQLSGGHRGSIRPYDVFLSLECWPLQNNENKLVDSLRASDHHNISKKSLHHPTRTSQLVHVKGIKARSKTTAVTTATT